MVLESFGPTSNNRSDPHHPRAAGTGGSSPRPRLRATSAMTAVMLAIAPAWSSPAFAFNISVTTPKISVNVNTGAITGSVNQATAAVGQAVGQVNAAVGAAELQIPLDHGQLLSSLGPTVAEATAAVLPRLPDLPHAAIAADATAAIQALTRNSAAVAAAPSGVGGHGLAALVGPAAAAAGHIQVRTGTVTLATGAVTTVDLYGDGLINFAVSSNATGAVAAGGNSRVFAEGQRLALAAAEVHGIVDNALNMNGVAQSSALALSEGRVALTVGNTAVVAATVDASGRDGRGDVLASIVGDAGFRPGVYAGTGSIRYGDQDTAAGAGPVPVWSSNATVLFGTVDERSGGSGAGGNLQRPERSPISARQEPIATDSLSLAAAILDPAPDQEDDVEEALTLLSQLDTLVGHAELAPTDVCQAAGGGGVGLMGCGTTEVFGAVVTLEPDATGSGCALLPAGGGLQLHCGGSDSLPGIDAPALEPSVTLQDLLDLLLQEPVRPLESPALAATGARDDQLAAVGQPGSSRLGWQ